MAGKQDPHQVFINCPFDEEYRPLFQCLIFTLLFLKLKPVFSVTTSSDQIRIHGIMNLIEKSRFGIHDISRNQASSIGEYARFNLPFELGLAIGCKRFGGRKHQHKRLLILDRDTHSYDQYIGDISGQDIEAHYNETETLIQRVRDWLDRIYPNRQIANSTIIWNSYNQFTESEMYKQDKIANQQMSEFRKSAKKWILNSKISK